MSRGTIQDLAEVFTYSEARDSGISDHQLKALQEQGVIERIARGLYSKVDLIEDHNLLELARRAPNATLCLGTALARHDLTDDIPPVIDAALPRRQRLPRLTSPVKWHRFDETTFALGREGLAVGSLCLGVYGPERSICDAFRLRYIGGYEEANEALKRWLRRSGSQPSTLVDMARHFGPRAETPIREALQVLL